MSAQRPIGIHLTPEQRAALEVRRESVSLAAGAGCGKTTVLTERFLSEIELNGNRPLRAQVALTFTEKAARELRQRIRCRCREQLSQGGEAGRWRLILRALENAPIGTFHQFCTGILRRHWREAGIDPEFVVLDENVASSLRDEAIRESVRELLAARDPDLARLAIDYGLNRVREAIAAALTISHGVHIGGFLELDAPRLAERWREIWLQRGLPIAWSEFAPAARRACRVLESIVAPHPRLADRRQQIVEGLRQLAANQPSRELLEELVRISRVEDLRGREIWPDEITKLNVKEALENLRKALHKVLEAISDDTAATLEAAENSLRLARLCARAWREFARLKQARRGLDFDDLLLRTLELLSRGTTLPKVASPASLVEFVLVDEFQDTDRIQSEILRFLGGEEFCRGKMFVVGDVKQSIYRFRGAEPEIFGQWREAFPARGRLVLTENYRSVPGVVHFVNALFGDCSVEISGEEGEATVEQHRLRPVRQGLTEAPVTFLWAVPPPSEPDPDEPRVKWSAEERRDQEARTLARWLRRRLEAGWSVVDRADGTPRPARPGDIALLFRAMTSVWTYEAALASEGFDYHTVGGSAFYAQQEIHDVVNVLSVVDDPFDEVALAGALRSPFFSLSDDGLYWLARSFPGGIAAGLARAAEIHELSDRDRTAAVRAQRLLDRWRSKKNWLSLGRLLEMILEESGFEAAVVCEFLGARKLANVRKLVLLARDFDRQGGFALSDLTSRLRADLDRPPREEQAVTTEEESSSIRLLSIHQAKGLEFPIVVIPDLNRRTSPRGPLVAWHAELGLLLRSPHRSAVTAGPATDAASKQGLGWRAYHVIEGEEERKESLRLFYVATTRARDHLILSCGFDPETGSDPDNPRPVVETSKCGESRQLEPPKPVTPAFQLLLDRFDWRTGRCRVPLPEGWPKPQVQVALETAPAQAATHGFRRSLRRLREIEQAISATTSQQAPAHVSRPRPCPRFIDLDPAAHLSSRSSRLDQLIRATAFDPDLLRGEPLEAVCLRLASRQVPAANAALIEAAIRWLEPWPATWLFQRLSALTEEAIKRHQVWTVPWPSPDQPTILFRGFCDLLARGRRDVWHPVLLTSARSVVEADRLRLLLSLKAAAATLGMGPAWWVLPGEDGQLNVEILIGDTASQIEATIRTMLETNAATPAAPVATP